MNLPQSPSHDQLILASGALALIDTAVMVCDAAGGIVFTNPEMDRLWGDAAHSVDAAISILNGPWLQDDKGNRRAIALPIADTLRDGRPVVDAVIGYRLEDGTLSWTRFSSFPMSTDVLPGGAVASMTDITGPHSGQEQQRIALELTDATLDRGRLLYRDTVEAMQDPVIVCQSMRNERGHIADFRYVYVNGPGAELLGRDRTELIGRSMLDLFPSVAGTERFDEVRRVVETGEALVSDSWRPNELRHDRSHETHLVRSGDGFVAVLHDVTQRNQDAQDLARRERQYHLLADHAGDVVVHRRGGIIEWVAPSVIGLLGWAADELTGTDVMSIVHHDDRHLLAQPSGGQAETQRRVRVRMMHRDGAFLWVETNSRPLPDADGTTTWDSIVSTIWNVQAEVDALEALQAAEASRQAMQESLEQAARLESLGVLAGGVAHDFNNLLVAVIGNIELVMKHVADDAALVPLLSDAHLGARRCADLTRQLLAYARQSPMAAEPLDLSQLVNSTLPLIRALVPSSAVLAVDVPDGLPLILADATQLNQVIMNLVVNAAESLADGRGQITLRTFGHELVGADDCTLSTAGPSDQRREVSIEVTDTGHGMTEETRSQMFEPFFSTKFAGRGLGLAAVHGIVHANGGTIQVSSARGHGTTIIVAFPALA